MEDQGLGNNRRDMGHFRIWEHKCLYFILFYFMTLKGITESINV